MAFRKKSRVRPFVFHGNVIDVEGDANHQADNEEAVRDDDVIRRSINVPLGYRVFYKIHQSPTAAPRAKRGKGTRGTSMHGWMVSSLLASMETQCHTRVLCPP